MNTQFRHLAFAAALVAAITTASGQFAAQRGTKPDVPAEGSKEEAHQRMRTLQQEIDALRTGYGSDRRIAELTAEYNSISATLGGDEPVRLPGAGAHSPALPPAPAVPTTCNGVTPTTSSFAGTNGPITPPTTFQGVTFTAVVSGAGPFLWDLNLNTNITHTATGDLDITLESPAGTRVVISTDNGGTFDNNFAGTLFDDNVNDPTTDHVYANLVTATPLSPEGRLTAFRGENPNGTWKLKILDDTTANTGNMNSWSLDISTLASAPVTSTSNFTTSPGLAVGPAISSVTSTQVVSGVGTNIDKVTLYLELPHTFASDLDITLTSPTGTVVTVTTDNGAGNDNVFVGTVFDPSSADSVTDHVYTNLVAATLLGPEGSFDNFLGQDPNGTWTLTVADDAGGDAGTLVRWDLNVTTSAPPSPTTPANFAGGTGAIPDFVGTVTLNPTNYTATVVGASSFVWDIDLTTFITHTSSGDIDMTLTSPAGTSVVITTDNGGTFDDNFNGTLWDDNANDPVTDHVFTNSVVATPLSPEGRLAAFRGENPNGVWTLTITDDAALDNGTLNSWSLGVSTVPSAPVTSTTNVTRAPNLAIPDVMTVSDTMPVSGLGTNLENLTLFVQITHTYAADLDITLTSPTGTIVVITTDNGASNDNVFNGTLFDPDSTDTVTDHVYANLVVATPLSPEGSFDNFVGQDPNGNWTLTITDDLGGDFGNLARWDLNITTCAASTPCIAYCFGDGSGTACPCGNSGAPGNGCASSINPAGGNLACSGLASISADSFALNGSGMPSSSALYFQGTTQINGGLGTVFGDGLRCAGGTVIRLGTKTNVGGSSTYPSGADVPISIKGANVAGGVRNYQCWYRNAAAFCTPSTFNLTNGVQTTWIP
jgi:subtilisin-like proprotein convertase family protein